MIHFGQMGDVILGLRAFRAIRERFPEAKITALVGLAAAPVVRIADVVDTTIVVDRVELRDGRKLRSIRKLVGLVRELRSRRFDLVIDLQSFYETNVLGFLSGAPRRLYGHRENRSLEFLGNFSPRPPREDRSKHLRERYLDVLRPLGIDHYGPQVTLRPSPAKTELVSQRLTGFGIQSETLIGLHPGAGHPSRRWEARKYCELAARLVAETRSSVIVFLGPEEKGLLRDSGIELPAGAFVMDDLDLESFCAAVQRMRVLIGNDTGPIHLAAVMGTPVVMLMDPRAPLTYMPDGERVCVLNGKPIGELEVDEVFEAIKRFLGDDEQ